MMLFETCAHMQQCSAEWELAGESVALVPTMGALHEGHMALVEKAKDVARHVVVSIFVNPLQFGLNEDLDAYPRMLERDQAMCLKAGVDVIFAPSVGEMYPNGFSTSLHIADITESLCGASRPGHFDGAATVVYLLMQQVMPHCCLFGEKDWQQLAVMRRMVADLMIPVELIGVPTIRESDGLALSSRNHYLSEAEREKAPVLYKTLCVTRDAMASGETPAHALEEGKALLEKAGFTVDYFIYADGVTLKPLHHPQPNGRLFVAAKLGTTRLIDNLAA
ncbi:MAG: pantoate--beta-alanine ligase [Rickettsiales bacterium]|nr:pantoate--beta-alanine ligase [Rickettsiales bacterium]|tara:strand:+ start:571 stop:1404 length:834 start_codon:yes stop_codon:yes gene_type:complete